jgi:hypothetical protein
MSGSSGGDSFGGALYATGATSITNSTLAANLAHGGAGGTGGDGTHTAGDGGNGGDTFGGGIFNNGAMLVLNCTIATNTAAGGTNGMPGTGFPGGEPGDRGASRGANVANGSAGVLELKNSIVAYGPAGKNGYGSITDLGNNLASDGSLELGPYSHENTDPKLGPLTDMDGTNQFMLPLAGSPAINAGDDEWAPETDQRGFPRLEPDDPASDIGAVEGQPPVIETQPEDRFPATNTTATLSVEVSGDGPVTYQWRFNGEPIPGATNSVYYIMHFSAEKAGTYDVVVENQFGTTISDPAIVGLGVALTITRHPQSQTVALGATTQFSVEATGTPPYTYRWRVNGTNITASNVTGVTNSVLVINNVQPANAGTYSVVVTSPSGTATSSNALLTVVAPLTPLALSANSLTVAFQSTSSDTYVTEFKNALTEASWTALITNTGNGLRITNSLPVNANLPGQFFRTRIR